MLERRTPPGPQGRAATGRTLGWGVVSTADIAEKVVPDIAALPDARLRVFYGSTEDHARLTARFLAIGLERDDLERTPFDAQGGIGRMYQLFGERMDDVIDDLNEALAA